MPDAVLPSARPASGDPYMPVPAHIVPDRHRSLRTPLCVICWVTGDGLCFDSACRVMDYARYLETLEDTESAPGCEQCTNNRLLLERVWQVRHPIWRPLGSSLKASNMCHSTPCTRQGRLGLFSSACMFSAVHRGTSGTYGNKDMLKAW